MVTIDKLEKLANGHGATVYDIHHRKAGWGITWYDEKLDEAAYSKDGLRLYRYYPSFQEMLDAEYARLKKAHA